jgi:hypothetical protein
MRVEQSQQSELLKVQSGLPGAAKAAPKTAFATVLAKSESKSSTTVGTVGGNTAPAQKAERTERPEKAERPIPKGPKGETTRPVKDHPAYVEIMSGPRNGMFINMTNNERRGEAFTLVRKHDRDLHVYGTGKDRRVIVSWHKDQPAHRADAKPDAVKETEKVTKPSTGGASASTAA